MAGFDWGTLATGLSGLLEQYNQNNARERQRRELAAGQAAAQAEQAKADSMIGDTVKSVAASTPGPYQQRSLADYSQALQRVRAAPGESLAPNLGSERYRADVGNRAGATRAYAGGQAFDLSQIDAVARQREAESNQRAALGSNLATVADRGAMELYLAKLRAARAQPNPWVTLLSQLGSRFGRYYDPNAPTEGGAVWDPSIESGYLPAGGGVLLRKPAMPLPPGGGVLRRKGS